MSCCMQICQLQLQKNIKATKFNSKDFTVDYSIKQIPIDERPRERLLRYGAESISSAELIAILLGTGMKGKPVLELANELLTHFGSLRELATATLEELLQVKGLGQAKSIQLKASFSLGMRMSLEERPLRSRMDNPLYVYNLLKRELVQEKREHFIGLFIDTKGFLISREVIAIGTLNEALIHPREVFYPAIRHKAASLIVAHNHPSGDPSPSKQDLLLTEKLIASGRMIGIPLIDHIIIAENGYLSLRQHGVLKF